MVAITRHVGKISNTGQKCVIVYRALPPGQGETSSSMALIVQTDQLPDMMHDNLMEILKSPAAQQTHDLFNVLNRRKFGDGSNMLESLHYKGYLKKVPIDNVMLYPMPNQPLPLSEANAAIGDVAGYDNIDKTTKPIEPSLAEQLVSDVPITESVVPEGEKSAIAAGLIAQADLLEADAKSKREEAYTLDPSLKPSKGRPALSEEEAERRKAEKNKKRREAYAKAKKEKAKA